jgi:Spy/CpxP family protein refolding chaperone
MSSRRPSPDVRRVGRESALRLLAPAVIGFWTIAAVATAQQAKYPIYTQDDFVKTMKSVGQNFSAIAPSLTANDFESAKGRVVRSREQLATTVTFWRDHQKEDAIKMWRAAITKMDELDTALSAENVDRNAASALVAQVSAACTACHTQYREQDPTTKAYRLKPGSVQ